jgi:hypothetical protein
MRAAGDRADYPNPHSLRALRASLSASAVNPSHASRITHHASRITHHASRITHHASRFDRSGSAMIAIARGARLTVCHGHAYNLHKHATPDTVAAGSEVVTVDTLFYIPSTP